MATKAHGKPTSKTRTREDDEHSYYIEDQPVEARKRYKQKLLYDKDTKSLPDPYKLTSNWIDDITTWADVTYGDIYNYLIDGPGTYTKESLKAYKSLDAYRYVNSGHVQVVYYHGVASDSPFCFLKAKVTPSQRVNKPHLPWVCVCKKTGSIYCAHCTCMAGLGETCSHIAAVLFKVQIAVYLGLTTTSSTSEACRWNNTFRKEVEPRTICEMQAILRSGNRVHPVTTVHSTGTDNPPDVTVLKELYSVCPNATFFTTIAPLEPELQTSKQKKNPRAPKTLTSLFETDGESVLACDDGDTTEICSTVWAEYSVSPEQSEYIESVTRDQSVSKRWYEHRKGRITASKAHDVFVRRESTNPDHLVKTIMGYNSFNLSKVKAVRWGLDNEDTARQQYARGTKTLHDCYVLRPCGLLIDHQKPFLGASADGLRTCKCCGKGTVEIKCPYTHRQNTIEKAVASDASFCLDTNMKLKTTHRYYTQIQMQMYVHQVKFCDFVLFTECDMVVNVVPYSDSFCQEVLAKCESFFKSQILPELLTGRLSLQRVENQPEKDTVYCICSEPAYGKMVQCSNASDCPMEWFHYTCVNIKRKPRGKWLCPSCK